MSAPRETPEEIAERIVGAGLTLRTIKERVADAIRQERQISDELRADIEELERRPFNLASRIFGDKWEIFERGSLRHFGFAASEESAEQVIKNLQAAEQERQSWGRTLTDLAACIHAYAEDPTNPVTWQMMEMLCARAFDRPMERIPNPVLRQAWVSVAERLPPESDTEMLVVCKDYHSERFVLIARWKGAWLNKQSDVLAVVTHWRELPPLPGEEEGNL